VTVQGADPEPVIAEPEHESPVSTGIPVPLRPTAVDAPFVELLATESCPVSEPATVGVNSTVSVAEVPGLSVTGRLGADTINSGPDTAAAVTITGKLPVELIVTVCVADVLTATLPKGRLVSVNVSMGLATSTSRFVVSVTPPMLAVSVTAWAELTDPANAVKLAVVWPAGIVTEAGTVIAELLLVIPTGTPPLPAVPFRVTEQLSLPVPGIEALAQLNALNNAEPTPLNGTEGLGSSGELVEMASWPVMEPETVGVKAIVRVDAPPPPARVIGKVFFTSAANPVPVKPTAEIWTEEEPRLTSETFAVTVFPSATEPKLKLPGEI
jgi:hypothetical protein